MTVDKEATKYIGLAIKWNYIDRKAHINMPGYLDKAFVRFKHEKPMKIQNSPHPHVIPQYETNTQYAEEKIDSPPLSKEETIYVQAVAGTLLYHARAVDPGTLLYHARAVHPTILTALSASAT